jgi:hypothetical protein
LERRFSFWLAGAKSERIHGELTELRERASEEKSCKAAAKPVTEDGSL